MVAAAAAAANGARFLFNPAKHDCIAFLGVSRGLATDCGASFYDFFFPLLSYVIHFSSLVIKRPISGSILLRFCEFSEWK